MKIAVTPFDASGYIEFENIVSYTVNEIWLTMTNDDGEVIWYRVANVEFFRVMPDEFDNNEVEGWYNTDPYEQGEAIVSL